MTIAMADQSGVQIAYETFGHPPGDRLLLVMGTGAQMLFWHDEFCDALTAKGFMVARFDNRDAGLSTHLSAAGIPNQLKMLTKPTEAAPYCLEDMADDAVAVLDDLGWDAAHVVGRSMGGMIAQTMAIRHPSRVLSLTSISSTPSPQIGRARLKTVFRLLVANPAALTRRNAAIPASGDRSGALASVHVPTLVLHGDADSMVRLEGGLATAAAIQGAKLLTLPGMGHDLPRELWAVIVDEIRVIADRTHDDAWQMSGCASDL